MGEAKVALPAWANEIGWESDVILSTRARLARNLADLPFPNRAGGPELKEVARRVLPIARTQEKGQTNLRAVEIDPLDEGIKTGLVDSHLISLQHAAAGPHRWALVDDRHTISVMVNEEDHLRLQAILPGLQVDAAYKIADQLDDQFAAQLRYATDPQYGFLTSSLSNCGTGLRLSVMAHLPGLAQSGKLEDALDAARTLGGTIRGLYGEHSGAVGDVYQLSNAVSIGLTERQILARLAASATYLLTDEQAARELLWRGQRSRIEELVGSSQERLKSADRLAADEAMTLLSALRLGEHCGLSTGVTKRAFNQLLASMRIGVQLISGRDAQTVFYEETRRPALIRNTLRAQK
jgi:protein arginine kinase